MASMTTGGPSKILRPGDPYTDTSNTGSNMNNNVIIVMLILVRLLIIIVVIVILIDCANPCW